MNKELIEKLKALLSKTQENGCTQAETEAAMAAAQRIAARNNIELASVRLDTGKPADIEITRTDLKSECMTRRPYHEAVAHVLVQCFDVKLLWRGNTPSAIVLGENTDVAIASYCWTWLESMLQRLYAEYLSTMPMSVARDAILARSYYYGVATGIIQNNKRVKEEAARQGGASYALVLVNKQDRLEEEYRKEFPTVKARRVRKKTWKEDAYYSGVARGREVKLAHGLV